MIRKTHSVSNDFPLSYKGQDLYNRGSVYFKKTISLYRKGVIIYEFIIC
jgi:hypothetical protein